MGGLAVRCAQSRGEWPGSRRTFFEGREEGARVDVEGKSVEVGGAREREGGARRVEAVEGGGRRVLEGLGGILETGGESGGIRDVGASSVFLFAFWVGRAGGGIAGAVGCCTGSVGVTRFTCKSRIGLTAVGPSCFTIGASRLSSSPASGSTTDIEGPFL